MWAKGFAEAEGLRGMGFRIMLEGLSISLVAMPQRTRGPKGTDGDSNTRIHLRTKQLALQQHQGEPQIHLQGIGGVRAIS